MDLNNYQKEAMAAAFFPKAPTFKCVLSDSGAGEDVPLYPFGKAAGEVGELIEKVFKSIRDGEPPRATSLAFELGDILWYVVACAQELGFSLSDIAEMNLEKLARREQQGTLGGSGDGR